MYAEVRVSGTFQGNEISGAFAIGPLELAELVSRRKGFDVVDCEPTDVGWKITAYDNTGRRTVTARGGSLSEAAENLTGAIWQ